MTAIHETDTARNAEFADLVALVRSQHARKLDLVAPASTLRSQGGLLRIKGSDAQLDEDGVTPVDGLYRPTRVFDEGIADKLGIPLGYLRRLRTERPDLYDANVNGWLHGRSRHVAPRYEGGPGSTQISPGGTEVIYPADERSFMVRCFTGAAGEGVARALLSNGYGIMDNLDALTAMLDGVKQAGAEIELGRCDLTERRMYVQVKSPAVSALAPALLKGYRSPFTGDSGDENPTVFAGFVLENSEVGNGAWSIKPQVIIQVCSNGMTITKDALRAVHVGSRLEDGLIRWTADTARKNVELVTAKTRDAVATFLDVDYLSATIAALEEKAGAPVAKPAEQIKTVVKKLGFAESHIDGILDHFIRGGQVTAGGVAQAFTSYSQTLDDADTAHELNSQAVRAMELVAA